MDLTGFTLIIDDTVHPDGTTSMEQVGGGGPQTLWGFQLMRGGAASVGLAAGVGQDFPDSVRDWLQGNIRCDLSGLVRSPTLPTPRAWQVMEWDGRRTQVWRSPECEALYGQLRPGFHQLPPSFQRSRNYHLGIHAAHPPMKLLRSLREAAHAQGGLLSIETYTSCDDPLIPHRRAELAELLGTCDVFSPNEHEAASMLPPQTRGAAAERGAGRAEEGPGGRGGRAEAEGEVEALRLLGALLELGAPMVLLRRGADGVLAAEAASGEAYLVPAFHGTAVRDVVGCGNACCGAFLAAIDAGLGLAASAAWGCAAGSVMAEVAGVPREAVGQLREDAARRQAVVLRAARRVDLGGPSAAAAARSGKGRAAGSARVEALAAVGPRAAGGWRCHGVPARRFGGGRALSMGAHAGAAPARTGF